MLSGGLREGVGLEMGFAAEAGLVFVINLLFLYFVGETGEREAGKEPKNSAAFFLIMAHAPLTTCARS